MVASTPVTVRITFCKKPTIFPFGSHQLLEITLGPIAATVDQAGATQAAIDWAWRCYRLDDLDVLDVEFETRPTRFWQVTFLALARGQTIPVCAVVLPDGRAVDPTIRGEM